MEEQVKCPKCGSSQITANKKGYSVGKAAAGVILTGGIGLVAGAIGSGAVKITCLSCGNSWKPKKLHEQKKQEDLIKNQRSLAEYGVWQNEFYRIYETGDFEKAKEHFLQKRVFHKVTPDVHQAYIVWKKIEKDNRRVLIIFFGIIILLISLIIWWLN